MIGDTTSLVLQLASFAAALLHGGMTRRGSPALIGVAWGWVAAVALLLADGQGAFLAFVMYPAVAWFFASLGRAAGDAMRQRSLGTFAAPAGPLMSNRPPISHRLFHSLRKVAPWAFEPLFVRRRRRQLRRMIADGHYDPAPDRPVHFPDYERSSPGRAIPHILHQTWKTDAIPPEFVGNVSGFERLHPGWRRVLWTDSTMEDFVREHFPQYLDKYLALPKNIMRADLFRYMVLWVQGGLYSDLDVVFLKPHAPLIDDCALFLGAETDDTSATPFVAQHMIGSCPRHEFWADLIDAALDRPIEQVRAYADPLDTTGPFFVTRVWRRGREKYRAKVVKMAYLCTPPWMMHPAFGVPGAAHSIHTCVGSWR